jgi:hypothetical protein
MHYTGFNDKHGIPITSLSFVVAPSKHLYYISPDPFFVYGLINVRDESIEKLTQEVASQLEVI